ncbi:hypothetical protein BN85402860 [Alteracholeplasma palmae J233]|uniref:Uncharacterized protein n=1 Tax=Alteracholeplasma palmae (strain ATCC 49389 / J233) TaxID=1318466 RepID=U4KK32_ALTPJ|nr:hypothetical protein BN85402860 [Alteracholeplasma palmae J233]
MYQNDPTTFEIVIKAFEQYKHEEYPFKVYKENYGYIRKYSKNNNGAPVINMKYLGDAIKSEVKDLSDRYNVDVTKKMVFQSSIKPFRVDVYYNGIQYKVVTVTYKDVVKKDGKYRIINYTEKIKKKEIDKKYIFRFSLFNNSIITIDNSEFYRFKGIVDLENKFEVTTANYRPVKQNKNNKEELDRIRRVINKKIKNITKYNVSNTGKIAKVEKEELKLVF